MSRRTQKIEELLREEMSRLIHNELTEKFGIITVTRVIATPDLKQAQIYFTLIDSDKAKDASIKLEGMKKRFQANMGRKLSLRYTPRLSFKIDEGMKDIDRIEELLEEMKNGN